MNWFPEAWYAERSHVLQLVCKLGKLQLIFILLSIWSTITQVVVWLEMLVRMQKMRWRMEVEVERRGMHQEKLFGHSCPLWLVTIKSTINVSYLQAWHKDSNDTLIADSRGAIDLCSSCSSLHNLYRSHMLYYWHQSVCRSWMKILPLVLSSGRNTMWCIIKNCGNGFRPCELHHKFKYFNWLQ